MIAQTGDRDPAEEEGQSGPWGSRPPDLGALRSFARAPTWLAQVVPPLLTFGSCVWKLGFRQLWRDEAATWWAAQLPLPELKHLLSNVDAGIGAYYLFMHAWIALFGDSVFPLRLPSALAMTLATWLVQRLAAREFGMRTGLWAGLMFAAIPAVTAFGQEARPYAFAVSAAIASTLMLLNAREQSESRARWAAYAASIPLLAYSHLVSLCLLFAHAALVLPDALSKGASEARRGAVRWMLACAIGLVPVLPLIAIASGQSGAISWIRADSQHIRAFPEKLFHSALSAGAVIALSLSALPRVGKLARLYGVWALFPPIFALATFDQLHFFLPRYMLFTLPAWAVLAGASVAALSEPKPNRWRLLPLLAVLACFAGLGQRGLRARAPHDAYDYKSAAFGVRERSRPGDAITFEGGRGLWTRIAFRYWLRQSPSLPRDIFAKTEPAEVGRFAPAYCREDRACLPDDVQRLWLVTSAPSEDLFAETSASRAELLKSEFEVRSVNSVRKLRYALLERRSPSVGAAREKSNTNAVEDH